MMSRRRWTSRQSITSAVVQPAMLRSTRVERGAHMPRAVRFGSRQMNATSGRAAMAPSMARISTDLPAPVWPPMSTCSGSPDGPGSTSGVPLTRTPTSQPATEPGVRSRSRRRERRRLIIAIGQATSPDSPSMSFSITRSWGPSPQAGAAECSRTSASATCSRPNEDRSDRYSNSMA